MTLTRIPDLRGDWEAFLACYPTVDERGRTIDPKEREVLAIRAWSARLPRDWQRIAEYGGGVDAIEQHLRDQRKREEQAAQEAKRAATSTHARFRAERLALKTEIDAAAKEFAEIAREPKFDGSLHPWHTDGIILQRRLDRQRFIDMLERYDQLCADEYRAGAAAKGKQLTAPGDRPTEGND
jgi:hypothetical protein